MSLLNLLKSFVGLGSKEVEVATAPILEKKESRSLVCQAAHASDIRTLVIAMTAMCETEKNRETNYYRVRKFKHPLFSTIISGCNKKLIKFISEELVKQPSLEELEALAVEVKKVSDTEGYRPVPAAWSKAEQLILYRQALLLEQEFSECSSFAELLALWKEKGPSHPGHIFRSHPKNSEFTDMLWQRLFNKLINNAETFEELKELATEHSYLQDGRYLLSNVLLPKWLSQASNFALVLEVLNWRSKAHRHWHSFDFDEFHPKMSSYTIEKLIPLVASFCVTSDDYATITKSLGGSWFKPENREVLKFWHKIAWQPILESLKEKFPRCSEGARDQILNRWRELGFDFSKDLIIDREYSLPQLTYRTHRGP